VQTNAAATATKAGRGRRVRPAGSRLRPAAARAPCESAPPRLLPRARRAYVPAMFVDSHCHLNYAGLIEDQPNVLARARAAGVSAMLNISTRASEWDAVLATAEREDDVMASVGIHPHEADLHPDVETRTLAERAEHSKVIGIGESGLDYYYDRSDRDRQRQSFRSHVAAARITGLPLIVHTRDAEADTYQILAEEMEKGAYPALIHCFTASRDFAAKALALGLTISISGIVTFKNARDLQETARHVPADRLLIETDSPFLAPVPHRGRPCEPAYVADTARFLAQLRGEQLEQLAAATTANFYRLFSKARQP
jgi:TatD DNase family protein